MIKMKYDVYFPSHEWILELEYDPKTMDGTIDTTEPPYKYSKLKLLVEAHLKNSNKMCVVVRGVNRSKVDVQAHAMANIRRNDRWWSWMTACAPGHVDGRTLNIKTTHHSIDTVELGRNFFPFFLVYDVANVCTESQKLSNNFTADMAFFDEAWIQHLGQTEVFIDVGDYTIHNGVLQKFTRVSFE